MKPNRPNQTTYNTLPTPDSPWSNVSVEEGLVPSDPSEPSALGLCFDIRPCPASKGLVCRPSTLVLAEWGTAYHGIPDPTPIR